MHSNATKNQASGETIYNLIITLFIKGLIIDHRGSQQLLVCRIPCSMWLKSGNRAGHIMGWIVLLLKISFLQNTYTEKIIHSLEQSKVQKFVWNSISGQITDNSCILFGLINPRLNLLMFTSCWWTSSIGFSKVNCCNINMIEYMQVLLHFIWNLNNSQP